MDMLLIQPMAAAVAFIWIGLILGISFLEAWLKFKAPGVTTAIGLSIGLSIGRLVFRAVNRLEWLLTIWLSVYLVLQQAHWLSTENLVLFAIITLLVLQTTWLLPKLNKRAQRVINNQPVKSSGLHVIYITAELMKVILLFNLGLSVLKDL
ncbi:hypothetical protein [Parapedobacter sp.]